MSAIARDFIPKKVGRVHVVVDAAPVCKKGSKKVTHAIGRVLSHKRMQ